ncbi:uncharacterized protein BN515_00986 [Firmicutes bacterium CAG:170]|jgi:hypothetical protein|nr:uncharacterized protein BN515_00986 [Firmicutes bacterium CAG:170]
MSQQHEILRSAPLLNASGDLAEPGWARSLLPVYRRSDIRVSPMRIKEWDYYLITDGHVGLALTIADNGYMGLDSVSFLDFDEGWEQTKSPMRLFPMGKTGLPESSADGASEIARGGYAMAFYHEDGARRLSFHMDRFLDGDAIEGIVTLSGAPEESMVIATPFDKPGHFYYNQKINCMRAEGWITLGKRRIELTPDRFFGVLDWGRGVWTYHNTWYWGSASGELDGVPFGWNIGYGFGNTAAASENVLFYDGRIHKLGTVEFHIPKDEKGRNAYLNVWNFTSDDNRFYMDFTPVLDRSALTSAIIIKSDQHQVFGRFTGRVTLDDGTVLPVRDFFGFAEKVENKW